MLSSQLYLDQGFYPPYFYFQQHQSDFRFPKPFIRYIQWNFASSNSDGSNTMDRSNCFLSPVNFAINSLSNKPQFLEPQFLEQSNYIIEPKTYVADCTKLSLHLTIIETIRRSNVYNHNKVY